jgi:PEP-CTERM motif
LTSRSLVLFCAATAVASLCSADLLYNQSFDGSGTAISSQNDTTGGFGNFATAYDNFTLPNLSTVSSVSWVGEYFDGSIAPIAGFTLQFYGDDAGTPGASIYSTFISGTANETDIGSFGGFEAYTYSATLGTAFTALGGTQYWLSIVPDLGFPPQWGWSTGTGGDGASYQVFQGSGASIPNDLAFELDGLATPEPFTFGLIGIGLAGIALAKFRRARS